jgi:hypothetical protein
MYLNCKERKNMCKVCKWWLCNDCREHLEIIFECGRNLLTIEETLLDKGILKKLKGKRMTLIFYTTTNKLKP